MAGSKGSRILWGAIVVPPLLLLGAAGVVTLWPQKIVGMMDAAQRAWQGGSSEQARPFIPLIRTPAPAQPAPRAILRGTVRTSDGRLPRDGYMLAVVPWRGTDRIGRAPSFGEGYTSSQETAPDFEAPIMTEPVYVVVAAEGYAPKVMGRYPEEWPPKDAIDDIPVEVVLEPGVPFETRVVDDQGTPILGAEVTARLIVDHRSVKLPNPARSDDDGRAVFANLSEADYEFEPNVHGFLYPDDAIAANVRSGGTLTIPLERGPLPGNVVDWWGKPVEGAVLLIAAEFDGRLNMATMHLRDRIILAKSGPEGRFLLPALHDESDYLIRAEDSNGSLGFAREVHRRDGELTVTLRPRGVVQGAFDTGGGGQYPTVMVQHAVATGFVSPGYNGDPWGRIERLLPINVGPKGGFSFPTWEGVETALMIEGRNIWVPWPPPEEPMRIDAATAAPTERTVRLRVRGDESIRAIEGTMALHLIETPPERAHQDVTRTVELRLGQGALQCLSSESFRYDSAAIPGVWTVPGRILGGGPPGDRLADVRAFAAGTIAGRVLEADGSPAGAGARIQAPFDPAWGRGVLRGDDPSGTDDLRVTAEEATTDAEGRFEIPAFPLNVLSRLVVERGRYFAVADAVQVLADDRRREVEFRLPKRAGAAVRVIDPEGRPIPGARLEVLLERSGTERRRWPIGQTDADGLAVVDDLAEGETDYSVIATFASDFQPIVAPLKPGGPTLELRAEPGHVLEGRVEEAVTGWGIPGVTLLAESVDGPTPTQVEVQTDWHGRFRLTTLPPGPIRLEDRLGLHWVSPRSPIVRAGTSEPVLIRVIDLPDSATRRNRLPEF